MGVVLVSGPGMASGLEREVGLAQSRRRTHCCSIRESHNVGQWASHFFDGTRNPFR